MDTCIIRFLINNNYIFSQTEIDYSLENGFEYTYDISILYGYFATNYPKYQLKILDLYNILGNLYIDGFNVNKEKYMPITKFEVNANYVSISYDKELLKLYLSEFYNEK